MKHLLTVRMSRPGMLSSRRRSSNMLFSSMRTSRHYTSSASIVLALLLAFSASFSAFAQDSAVPAVAPSQPSLQEIVAQQAALRAQVAAKRGAFKDMHDGDRDRLINQQDKLLQLLDGRQSIEELRVEQRVDVFNYIQNINAAVTKAEDERQICERSRLVGTNRFQVVCMTAKQNREHRENAKKSVRTIMKCDGGCASD
jgi:hypothetical protein